MKHLETEAYCTSVLPNTLGSDIFVSLDKHSLAPVRTELLTGDAFPLRYFKEYIEIIEYHMDKLSHPITIRNASYCRIFVIDNSISFLAFTNDSLPVMRGKRQQLCSDACASVVCAKDSVSLVYVDVWIRTEANT